MKYVVGFFAIVGFTIIGAANTPNREWVGALGGCIVGLFIAFLLGGLLPRRWVDAIFPR